MENIIIILIVIAIILLVSIFFILFLNMKNITQGISSEKINENEILRSQIQEILSENNVKQVKGLYDFKGDIFEKVNQKMTEINSLLEKKLKDGFEKSDKTFKNLLERMVKIDEAQKNIEGLSKEVVTLNDVLTDKKTRGIFGEVQLYQMLEAVFGAKETLYKKQKKLGNNNIVDAVVFAPEPLGMISIDSKFPYENYNKMLSKEETKLERDKYRKMFMSDVKRHINDISEKYIIEGETSNQAIMFIPAEAIFAEITARHGELVDYGNNKRVWMASPTTLFSTLTMVQVFVQNIQRDKKIKLIVEEINKLNLEFERYNDRWNKFSRGLESVVKESKLIHTTTDKIRKKFDNIKNAKLDKGDAKQIKDGDE